MDSSPDAVFLATLVLDGSVFASTAICVSDESVQLRKQADGDTLVILPFSEPLEVRL